MGSFFEKFDAYFTELALALIDNEFIDLMMAERIVDTLKEIIGKIDEYPAEAQTIIYGASLYFLEDEDAFSDKSSPDGLEDDVLVVNLMLQTIGRPELNIEP